MTMPNVPSDNEKTSPRAAASSRSTATMFSYGGGNALRWLKNTPASQTEEAFITSLESALIDGVSQRTFKQALEWVRRTGEVFFGECTLMLGGQARRFEITLNPHINEQILGVANDLGERTPNDQAVRMLSLELAHRTKNLMAVISSLAIQTGRRAKSVDAFTKCFVGQIGALARAHDAIASTGWRGAALDEVIDGLVKTPRRGKGVSVNGDSASIFLSPSAVQNICMAFHELVSHCDKDASILITVSETKANKLTISWSSEKPRAPELMWTELLTDVIPMALGGGYSLDYESDMLRYSFETSDDYFSVV